MHVDPLLLTVIVLKHVDPFLSAVICLKLVAPFLLAVIGKRMMTHFFSYSWLKRIDVLFVLGMSG